MNSAAKKYISALILFAFAGGLLAPVTLAPLPQKSEAQAQSGIGAVLNIELNPAFGGTPDVFIRILMEALKRYFLNQLTNMVVAWIQGSGNQGGKPLIIGNWKSFLQGAFDLGFDQIVRQLGLGFLCQPFNLQVQLAFQSPIPYAGGIPNIQPIAACTLDKIVKNAKGAELFFKDFRYGGFNAYSQSLFGMDNYYGKLLLTHDLAVLNSAKAREAAQNEALAGRGTVSQRGGVCVEEQTVVDPDSGEEVTSCLEYGITTPGSIIADSVTKAITIDLDGIVNSRDIETFIAAVVGALINRVITGGGLAGVGSTPVGPKPTVGSVTGGQQKPVVKIRANGAEGGITLNNPPVSYTISWQSTGAAGCEASGDWSGVKPASGSETFSGIGVGSYTYTISCANTAGLTTEASVKVDVYE